MEKQIDRSFLPCSTERLVTIEQVVVAALKKAIRARYSSTGSMYKGDAGISHQSDDAKMANP